MIRNHSPRWRPRKHRTNNFPSDYKSKSDTEEPDVLPQFWDEGTKTFSVFWNYHTVSVLAVLIVVLVYVSFFEKHYEDREFNTKRGIVGCIVVFICYGMTQARDGIFTRPHPAFWRLVLCLSVVYELFLIFLLFQTAADARRIIAESFDRSLGRPLPEVDYGGSCQLYDTERPDDPFHAIKDKMDTFIFSHFFGWVAKMLMFRDVWFCLIQSFLFEVLEYTLEHQLPNFSECWWDHWILDFIVCNGAGIWVGAITLRFLEAKNYHWRSLWHIPTFRGKLNRVFAQFTPYNWTAFYWQPFESLTRWLNVIALTTVTMVAELNSFYLKFILYIPPPHPVNIVRLVFIGIAGMVGTRETYSYINDSHMTRLGQQAWVLLAIVATELLIIIRFAKDTLLLPFPRHILIVWGVGLSLLALYTIFYFLIPGIKNWQYISKHRRTKERFNNNYSSSSSRGDSSDDEHHVSLPRRRLRKK